MGPLLQSAKAKRKADKVVPSIRGTLPCYRDIILCYR